MSTTLVEQAPPAVTPPAVTPPALTPTSTAAAGASVGAQSERAYPADVAVKEEEEVATDRAPASAVPSPPLQAQAEVESEEPLSGVSVAKGSEDAAVESAIAATASPKQHQAAAAEVEQLAATAWVPPRDGATRKEQLSLAQKRLAVQLQFAESARKKIEDETHPDLQSRLAKLERERDALLALAKQHEEYLQHTTAVIFAYECDEANSEFELSCEKLRQDMLEEIHHEMEIINDQRNGGASSSDSRKTTRKTRSTRSKNGEKEPASAFGLDTAQKNIKKRAGYVFQPLEKRLAQSEVDFDLRELNGIFESSKKRRMEVPDSEDLPGVRCHRGKLLYRDWIFQEGDDVFVQNYALSSAYIAVVVAVTSTEVFLLSEKGAYARLVVVDLRQGKVGLSPLTHEQSAALAAREERARALAASS